MKRIIVLGDTHGRSFWKLPAFSGNYDRFIFIGDYFDTKDDISVTLQMHNFKEIVEFKKKFPDKVILLFGNHDAHYLPEFLKRGEYYSGFQRKHCWEISSLIVHSKENMQLAHSEGEFVFTHAGITKSWLKFASIKEDEKMINKINLLFKRDPDKLTFNGLDPYGDNITQSPIWVRPASLDKDRVDGIHVVGHTSVKRLIPTAHPNIILIDCLGKSGEYLVIDVVDGETKLKVDKVI
jgi:hypothetical protein